MIKYITLVAGLLLTASVSIAAPVKVKSYNVKQLVTGEFCVLRKNNKWKRADKIAQKYGNFRNFAGCTALNRLSKLNKLGRVPSADKIISDGVDSSSFNSLVQSGTPPTLSEIASGDPTSVFWRSGVISSINNDTATSEQCNEFWSGNTDGFSGGIGACGMTAQTAYSFAPVAQSATSACYLKNGFTNTTLNSGGVQVVSGSLPQGGISAMTQPPVGSVPRIIKAGISGFSESEDAPSATEYAFIKVYGTGQNAAAGNRYKVDLWFCNDGETTPHSFEGFTIKNNGRITTTSNNDEEDGIFISNVSGWLIPDGPDFTFDTTKPRTAVIASSGSYGSFKSEIEIDSNNKLSVKSYDSWSETQSRMSYIVSNFSGTSLPELRFFEGATKERQLVNGDTTHQYEGATEYRDTYYASVPASSLLSDLAEVDFDADPFYSDPPAEPEVNIQGSCNAEADLELLMDFSNEVMQGVSDLCETDHTQYNFCWDGAIQNGMNNWFSNCM